VQGIHFLSKSVISTPKSFASEAKANNFSAKASAFEAKVNRSTPQAFARTPQTNASVVQAGCPSLQANDFAPQTMSEKLRQMILLFSSLPLLLINATLPFRQRRFPCFHHLSNTQL